MSSIQMAFLLTTLAGLSTMLGSIPIFIKLKNENKIIAGSLAFAAGVMICVSVTDLIPEAVFMLEQSFNGMVTVLLAFLFLMIGIVASGIIDKKLPTTTKDVPLYKVGIVAMLAIILHNIPEDCVQYATQ